MNIHFRYLHMTLVQNAYNHQICSFPDTILEIVLEANPLNINYFKVCAPYDLPICNMSQPLPGPVQTNNRAEIYAVVVVVQNLEFAAGIYFRIVVQNYQRHRLQSRSVVPHCFICRSSCAGELPKIQTAKLNIEPEYPIMEEKHIDFRVHWMPSHTDTDPQEKQISLECMEEWYVSGSKHTHVFAVADAERYGVTEEEAKSTIKGHKGLGFIQHGFIYHKEPTRK